MKALSRRALLGAAAAAGVAGLSRHPLAAQPARRFLSSDIGRLGRVLVHGVSPLDLAADRISEDLLPYAESDLEAAAQQHQALFALLRAQGATTIEVADALDAAIAATRASGVFEAWLSASFPGIGVPADRVSSATILGRDPATRLRLGADGSFRHMVDDSSSLMWTRDSAFMAPQGLVMGRSSSSRRRRENMLLRFLYRWSPMLADFPVAFDAVAEGLNIEGGDAMVVNEKTLFLGVGNRTDPRIAPVLARRLGMDVLTVNTYARDFIPPPRPGAPMPLRELRILLLHLDTFFTLVGPRHALAVPFLLEQAYGEDGPYQRYIRGARAETQLQAEDAEKALDMLKDFGRVTLFRAGTGAKEDQGQMKLVDWVRKAGWKLTWVGGTRPAGDEPAFQHMLGTVHPELRRQAANVVQAQPGRVIAYAGNPVTKAALEADGIAVDTFGARELWAWHGGPHCLTQPLERS
jgi:arginine deiminase